MIVWDSVLKISEEDKSDLMDSLVKLAEDIAGCGFILAAWLIVLSPLIAVLFFGGRE